MNRVMCGAWMGVGSIIGVLFIVLLVPVQACFEIDR